LTPWGNIPQRQLPQSNFNHGLEEPITAKHHAISLTNVQNNKIRARKQSYSLKSSQDKEEAQKDVLLLWPKLSQ